MNNKIKCKSCNQDINTIEQAYVEWIEKDGVYGNINIIHHIEYSPKGTCFMISPNEFHYKSLELSSVLKNQTLTNDLKLGYLKNLV